ncbi:MAG: hypothetical protein M0T86_02765 [Betaproteobacteria bacterium]|nr:hypothetical protein [Betaproteobacteria bacterium]
MPDRAATLSVVIPGLIPPAGMTAAVLEGLTLPALGRLMARAERMACSQPADTESLLCQSLGIDRQTDWPTAPIDLQAEGVPPGSTFWLHADPVHLRAARHELILVDSSAFAVTAAEAAQYVAAFNDHFGAEGYQLVAPDPQRWYLRVPGQPVLATRSLHLAAGAAINPALPQGADALRWHRLFNEIQMLFFDLPVNRQREARGEAPINSVWLWGGGTLPPPVPDTQTGVLWGNPRGWRNLATFAGLETHVLPDTAPGRLPTRLDWLILDALHDSARYADYAGWKTALLQLEQHWFAPLIHHLATGQARTLDLWSFHEGHGVRWRIHRLDLARFWRRTPLMHALRPPASV